MADILLTVGVDPTLSYTEFRDGLDTLVSKINAHPPRIKVELDDSSIKTIKKELEILASSAKKVSQINTGGDWAKGQSGIWVKTTSDITKNTDAKLKNAKADAIIVEQTKKKAAALEKEGALLKKLEEDKAKALSKTTINKNLSSDEAKEYAEALNKVNALLGQVTQNKRKWAAAEGGKTSAEYQALKNQETALLSLRENLKAATISIDDFKDTFLQIKTTATDVGTSIKVANENMASFEVGSKKNSDVLKKVRTLMSQVKTNLDKWQAAKNGETSGEYKSLVNQAEALERLEDQLLHSAISAEKFETAYSGIGASIAKANAAIKAAHEDTGVFTTGSKQQADALKQINARLVQVSSAKKNWTMAKDGKSSFEYNYLDVQEKTLESLKKSVSSCAVPINEFEKALRGVDMVMDDLSTSIKIADEDVAAFEIGTKEHADALGKVDTLIGRIHDNSRKWSAAKDGNTSVQYDYMLRQVDVLKSLREQVMNVEISPKEFQSALAVIQSVVTRVGADIKEAGEDVETFAVGSKKHLEAVIKVDTLVGQASDSRRKWSAAKDGKSSNEYKNLSKQIRLLKKLGAQLADGALSANEFEEAFKRISAAISKSGALIKNAGENTESFAVGSAKHFEALAKVHTMIGQITENRRKWSAAKDGESSDSYRNLGRQIGYLKVLTQHLLNGSVTAESFERRIRKITAAVSESNTNIKIAGENMEAFTSGGSEHYDALIKVDNLISQITENTKKWKAAENGTASEVYHNLVNQITILRDLEERLLNNEVSKAEYADEIKRISADVASYNSIIKEAHENTESFAIGSTKHLDAIGKVNVLRGSVSEKINKWSAAEHGDSANEYHALVRQKKALEELGAQLMAGTISAEEFEKAFKEINAIVSSATATIKAADEDTGAFMLGFADHSDALTKVHVLISQITENTKKWKAAENGTASEAYHNLVKQIEVLRDLESKLLNNEISKKDYITEIKRISADVASYNTAIKEADENTESFAVGSKKHLDALTKVGTLSGSLSDKINKWKAAENGVSSAEYKNLVEQEEALRKLGARLLEGSISAEEFEKAFKEISAVATTSGAAIKRAKEDVDSFAAGSEKHLDALIKVSTMRGTIADNLNKWKAAENGESSEHYKELIAQEKALRDLGISLLEGSVSAEEFVKSFKEINAVVASSNAAIKVANENHGFALGFDTKEQYEMLKKIDKAITDIVKKQKAWTAAGESKKTRADFLGLKDAKGDLEALRAKVSEGILNPKDAAAAVDELARIQHKVESMSTNIISLGKNTQSFGDKIAGVAKQFTYWFSTYEVMMYAVNLMKQMAATAVEIESSMTQIRIVTGASDYQMETFLTKSISLAKELGKSVTEVASSIETFARLGYNMEDSSVLAKYANIMSNVANTDVDSATTGLTSIIKGYELSPEDAERVSDVLVKVGQEYAISASELMEAFQRGGAALHASGTDFEKSAALFAATNASLQNAETTGKHICPVA